MSTKTSPKKNLSQTDMVRKVAAGILKKEPEHTLPLCRLKTSLEELLDMKLRSDHLETALRKDPRFVVCAESEQTTISLSTNGTALSVEEFVLRALEILPKPEYPERFHTVFSGFNRAFREYFPGLDPVAETRKLADSGKIRIFPARGGATIAKVDPNRPVKPPIVIPEANDVLNKMGLTR
jgi:hypothetical protein